MHDITVYTPYMPGRSLAKAYNKYMRNAPTEWVLLLDWDLFNCNPYWYDMCQYAIKNTNRAGWITCYTNRIGAPQQKLINAPKSHDIIEHMQFSKKQFEQHSKLNKKGILQQTDIVKIPGALSGFFILTNKTAWKKADGFDENKKGLMGVDNRYSQAVQRAGFKLYLIPGLYFYHIYREKKRIWKNNGYGFYGLE
jgi:GT2 family glycosyltransferase